MVAMKRRFRQAIAAVFVLAAACVLVPTSSVRGAEITGRVDVDRALDEPDTIGTRLFLRSPDMLTTRRSGPITIRCTIRDGAIHPGFQVVRLRDTVTITNQDSIPRLAIVFEDDRTHLFGPLAPGTTARFEVTRFGPVEMSTDAPAVKPSILFVAENPFTARADTAGSFRFDGVPPGDYRVIAWRPGRFLGEATVRLEYEGVVDAGLIEAGDE